ncbi:MAG: glycosyltransferase [Kiritimatiellae bacterium]|nr:glycosyltransferase [Kiritimatiellia bacterium]
MLLSEKNILWWGRSDPAYSRNAVLRRHLSKLGWRITDFNPAFSGSADLEACLRRIAKPDLVWVPCFRQRDMAAARRWCDRQHVPLLFDPLISAYDKQVWERFKLPEGSRKANRLLKWERELFSMADILLADTSCHAAFFTEQLGSTPEKTRVVYVGADEDFFRPAPALAPNTPAEVLFYGSFIPLHGTQTIIEAARLYQGPPVRWCLLGDGPAKINCQKDAAGLDNVVFEDRIPYAELPARIHRAEILLGVFGTTMKAGRVIPNKVFQALASGRPVITRMSEAYPMELADSEAMTFVPPGDAHTLASAVASACAADQQMISARNRAAREIYDLYFSEQIVLRQIESALAGL